MLGYGVNIYINVLMMVLSKLVELSPVVCLPAPGDINVLLIIFACKMEIILQILVFLTNIFISVRILYRQHNTFLNRSHICKDGHNRRSLIWFWFISPSSAHLHHRTVVSLTKVDLFGESCNFGWLISNSPWLWWAKISLLRESSGFDGLFSWDVLFLTKIGLFE